MTKPYALVIPSRERATWLRGRTTNTLKHVAHLSPILYVREDDSQMIAYRDMADEHLVDLMVQPATALGAAQTYDSLIEWGIRNGHERLVILDDDLHFTMKNPIPHAKPMFKKTGPKEIDHLLHDFARLTCSEIPAMSMTPIMKRSQNTIIAFSKPLMWTYSFFLPHFRDHPEHRFWVGEEIEARCDLNLSIRMLRDGFLLAYLATVFIPDNVNNPGGCSTYRDLNMEEASVRYLVEKYPDIVSTHKMKGWVGDPDVERDAPRIAWSQAFNARRFAKRFGFPPQDFASATLRRYEHDHSSWIQSLRAEATDP